MSFAGGEMFMDCMKIKIMQKEEVITRNNASRFKLENESREKQRQQVQKLATSHDS